MAARSSSSTIPASVTRRENATRQSRVRAHLVDLAGGAVGLLVALEVAVVAHALALDERRPAAGARGRDGLAGRLVHGEEVDAVDLTPGMPKPAARSAMSPPSGGSSRRQLGVAVVLDDEDHRQLQRGRGSALDDRALVRGAVADERHGDLSVRGPSR